MVLVLAWRIPGTEEPGKLPSMGSHRVGHDWSDSAAAAALLKAYNPECNWNRQSAVDSWGQKESCMRFLTPYGHFLIDILPLWYAPQFQVLFNTLWTNTALGFLGGSVVKNLPANSGDEGSISGSGRSSEEGNGNPLQCSCLGNLVDREVWWATVHGVTKMSDAS